MEGASYAPFTHPGLLQLLRGGGTSPVLADTDTPQPLQSQSSPGHSTSSTPTASAHVTPVKGASKPTTPLKQMSTPVSAASPNTTTALKTDAQKAIERGYATELLRLAQGPGEDYAKKNRNVAVLINTLDAIAAMQSPPPRPADWEALTGKGELLREAANYFWGGWNLEERLFWLRTGEHKLHIGSNPTATGLPLARTGVRSAHDMPHMCIRMILRRVFGKKVERVHWWNELDGVEKEILHAIQPIDHNLWLAASGDYAVDSTASPTDAEQTQQNDALFDDSEDVFASLSQPLTAPHAAATHAAATHAAATHAAATHAAATHAAAPTPGYYTCG
ncbi:hypothetical protein NQ176_g7686 [Zarea fungicola]|uniref:Uncharacterized protein n=1 Tax=Zarea fungicola TaxID=93591 RepID=A0ACC1MWP2_9HYPO|nr:hypothetical protein NQ176_g7686 [Lecanicillium fungicola]